MMQPQGGGKLYLLLEELKQEAGKEAKHANTTAVRRREFKRSAAEAVYRASVELQSVVKEAYQI